jgi:soluble lytic murein transglycosylase-like protein
MRWFLILIASSALAQNNRDALQAAMEKQRAAAAIQRESVRKQREPTAQAPLLAESNCEAIADSAVNPIIEGAAKAQELEAKMVRAVIQQESAFRPCAVSAKGAKGLMQLMPEIIEQFKVSDPFDAKESIEAGARYLKQLLDRYKGDLALTLGAYNAGPTAVDEAKGVPNIPETRSYVEAILQALGKAAPGTPAPIPPAAPTQIDPPRIPKPKPIEN